MERPMRDVHVLTRHELVGMRSLLLAMLSLFVAMQCEHRATRSAPFAMRRLRRPRIHERSHGRRELGSFQSERGVGADV
jgi:hypothetical protein